MTSGSSGGSDDAPSDDNLEKTKMQTIIPNEKEINE